MDIVNTSSPKSSVYVGIPYLLYVNLAKKLVTVEVAISDISTTQKRVAVKSLYMADVAETQTTSKHGRRVQRDARFPSVNAKEKYSYNIKMQFDDVNVVN